MPRPPQPPTGRKLQNQPRGAPVFYAGRRLKRIVTSNPWSFLNYESRRVLPKEQALRAAAYIEQAFDFFEAAANPRTSSRPLLYYYSFLNLAKVLILHRRVNLPLLVKHGISDPKANIKQRLRFPGQRIRLVVPQGDHSELFPEFLLALEGGRALCGRHFRVIDLLGQIAGIHRTACAVLPTKPRFCPVEGFEFYSDGNLIWALMNISWSDSDARESFPSFRKSRRFRQTLYEQVAATKEGHLCFRTKRVRATRRGIDKGIGRLSRELRGLGIHAILTQHGYRYYLANFPPRELIPQLCSIYAVMFYLGSITRYKPHHFDAIVSRGYDWLVEEFLETQPTQFIYLIASHVAGVEVAKPFATVSHG